MTNKITAMRERRNALAKDTRNLLDQNPGANWNAEHQKKYDENTAEIVRIDAELDRHQKILDLEAERDFSKLIGNDPGANGGGEKDQTEAAAVKSFLRGGLSNLSDDQRGRMRQRQNSDIQNAMSTTTGSEGGYTVAEEWNKKLEEALKAYGGMRAVATVIRTATGAALHFPKTDATSEEGEIVGQNVAASALDTTFSTALLGAFKYSSKSIALPFELLQDSFLDIESYVLKLLATRIGRIQNRHYTVGAGTTEPFGIVTTASAGKVGATGETLTVSYDDLVDLEHSVDPAYRGNGKYMMHDTSVKVLRKLKDAQNRPIFVPGYEANAMINGGAPDTLMGRAIQVNQNMPVMAANAKSILFGDFSKYTIRDVMDLTLFRMTDSAFTLKGQVGFVGFLRSDGNLIDAGGAVKYFQNSAT